MPRPGRRGLLTLSAGAPWRLEQSVWVGPSRIPRGLAIDRSGRHLLIADGVGGLLVADTARLATGTPDPFTAVLPSPGAGSMQVVLGPDQRLAFVTDEDSATMSVFDFGSSLSSPTPAAKLAALVPLPPGPVGVACRPDGRHLFVTSQVNAQGGQPGVLTVVSIENCIRDPAHALVGSVPAGHTPVRVACAPSGETVWVSARGSNAVLAFDAGRLVAGEPRALRAVVPVGAAPVGLALLRAGSLLVVANSNRYDGADRPQTLSVVDADAALRGRKAMLGTIPAGVFPRELAVLPDDRTVLVTNVFSQSLQAVSVVP